MLKHSLKEVTPLPAPFVSSQIFTVPDANDASYNFLAQLDLTMMPADSEKSMISLWEEQPQLIAKVIAAFQNMNASG